MKLLTEYLSVKIKPSIIYATDTTIFKIIDSEIKRLGNKADLNHIDVSKVTTFYQPYTYLFSGFSGDVSRWNMENCKDMSAMFNGCTDFNCDISEWNVENVENISSMFMNCDIFNQDLSKWQFKKLVKAYQTFRNCKAFNQDLSNWDYSHCNDTSYMFYKCKSLDKDFSKINLPEENCNYGAMFRYTKVENCPNYMNIN